MTQQVYSFDLGDGKNKQLLGGKGANLCEMTQIGLNVPPGFVISTQACLSYLDTDKRELSGELMEQVVSAMHKLEKQTGKGFGDPENPLLISVRSGSAMSMPGMMDTILNLGLNSQTLQGEIKLTGDARFGYDSYRRFIQLFGKVAMNIDDRHFDEVIEQVKVDRGVKEDVDLTVEDLSFICEQFLDIVQQQTGRSFPEDPHEQLALAIKAVFDSWMGKRAVDYRREFNITPAMANGTAVNICTMVFGNRGNDSATGVAFTRNPATGENRLYGEYLTNAQGEDVVAGIRTPKPIDALAEEMPDLHRQLEELRSKLETHYAEIQDFEFTIERGTLYCLQTRNGKMNATAMVRTSVEMERAGLIDKAQALGRIDPEHLEQMLYPRLAPDVKAEAVARGLAASPGAASGIAIFDADRAETIGKAGQKVILLREETKPEDIHGFFAAQGILTSRGGKTSHAAVVARGMGKPCVAGAEGIAVDDNLRLAYIGDLIIKEGDWITIDGTSGDVYQGDIAMVEAEFTDELHTLLGWADDYARLEVLANADTPDDARRATRYGAMGIGLCRTERMFNDSDRLPIVIEMIVAEDKQQRQEALDRLLPIQRSDFKGIFEAMAPRPVTIRLLDPPIHEFLPSEQQLQQEIVKLKELKEVADGIHVLSGTISLLNGQNGNTKHHKPVQGFIEPDLITEAIIKKESMVRKVRALFETNPMLGHRGVRLGITFPEIYTMQIRAILEAAAECALNGMQVTPHIMVPQVATVQELKIIKGFTKVIHQEVEQRYETKVEYRFGSMVEVVRACMRAGSLAEEAEFFSFGTNDLSQATFSFSREDAENKFLPLYNERVILRDNPFEVLDILGVGKLMELAVDWGRETRPGMSIGICGEHGGHPQSIDFCDKIGLDYVSCSAPRVPIARLAVAQSVLKQQAEEAEEKKLH